MVCVQELLVTELHESKIAAESAGVESSRLTLALAHCEVSDIFVLVVLCPPLRVLEAHPAYLTLHHTRSPQCL